MDGWIDGWMDGWVHGWMDGWIDRWIDGWMDGCSLAHGVGLLLRSIPLFHSQTQCWRGQAAHFVLETWYFSFARHGCHHLRCHSATINSAQFVVKATFLESYLFHGTPVKPEHVIATHFTAVCVQTSPSKIHHEVIVNGGSII